MKNIKHNAAPGKAPSLAKKRDRLPQGLRFDVFRRDNFACVYCGGQSPQVTLECDHLVARSKGGPDTMDNLVTACWDCNRGKAAKDVDHKPRRAERAPVGDDPLKGCFGHGWDGEFIGWQFEIKSKVGDRHKVQLFSWLTGDPTDVKFIPTTELVDGTYTIYQTESDWLRAAEKHTEELWRSARSKADKDIGGLL